VVASPLEVRQIRQTIKKEGFLIVTPGIRSQKSEVRNQKSKTENQNPKTKLQIETYEDQKRVMSAAEAVTAGADYLVIGRPILQAEDRILTVKKILEEIESV